MERGVMEKINSLMSSIKGEVKKKHISCGWTFSCFAAHLIDQGRKISDSWNPECPKWIRAPRNVLPFSTDPLIYLFEA
jgi:hypothetical protein